MLNTWSLHLQVIHVLRFHHSPGGLVGNSGCSSVHLSASVSLSLLPQHPACTSPSSFHLHSSPSHWSILIISVLFLIPPFSSHLINSQGHLIREGGNGFGESREPKRKWTLWAIFNPFLHNSTIWYQWSVHLGLDECSTSRKAEMLRKAVGSGSFVAASFNIFFAASCNIFVAASLNIFVFARFCWVAKLQFSFSSKLFF